MTTTREMMVSFALFAGGNDAIGRYASAKTPIDGEADLLGINSLHMACIRVAALFDREGSVSLQRIYRDLGAPGVIDILATRASDWPMGRGPSEVHRLADEFRPIYCSIDWRDHSALKALRNVKLAHITEEDLRKTISLGSFEELVMIAIRLCYLLMLIADGFHHNFETEFSRRREAARDFWIKVIEKTYGYSPI